MAKKPEFEKTGQNPTVIGTFELLLDDHDTFSAALVQKISANFVRADAVVDIGTMPRHRELARSSSHVLGRTSGQEHHVPAVVHVCRVGLERTRMCLLARFNLSLAKMSTFSL